MKDSSFILLMAIPIAIIAALSKSTNGVFLVGFMVICAAFVASYQRKNK